MLTRSISGLRLPLLLFLALTLPPVALTAQAPAKAPAQIPAQTPTQAPAPTFPPAAAPPTDPHTLEVQQAVHADMACFLVALRTRNSAELDKCWAPEMLVNSPANKVLTRAEVIAAMSAGKLDYRDTHITVEHFSTTGDIAIEMGHEDYVPITGPEAGKTLYRRFTNFYIRRDGHWMSLARQATIYDPTAVHY